MGAAESVVRNVDKRTARREQRDTFIGAIRDFRGTFDARPADADGDPDRPIRVYVRKRPMFDWEWKKEREFDVITGGADRVVIHDARMEANMISRFMDHHEFEFDSVFGERATNDDVYAGTAAELVRLAAGGGLATVLMYGQTGSGKTYTMSSIYERAAADLFSMLGGEVAAGGVTVSVSFVELAGDRCRDMLNSNGEGGREPKLCTGRNGEVHPVPVTEVPVTSPADLVTFIDHATSLRATSATSVHDASSRSHAVCRVYVNRGGDDEGVLTLVDLAGSEHRIDSMYHDAARRKEGAQINSSLMALKQVVRARVDGSDTSLIYRKAKLTLLLKTSFSIKEARTVVIATVSPSSKDTEHSLSTLRHACIMDGQGEGDEKRWTSGGNVTRVSCGDIDVGAVTRSRRANGGASADLRGGGRGAEEARRRRDREPGQFSDSGRSDFGDAKLEKKKQEKAKEAERRKAERAAMRALDSTLAAALVEARAACASGVVQRRRLMRGPAEMLHGVDEPVSDAMPEGGGYDPNAYREEDNTLQSHPHDREPMAQLPVSAAAQHPARGVPRRKGGDAAKRRQLTAQVMSDATTPAAVKIRQLKVLFRKKGLDWTAQDEEAAIAVAAERGQELSGGRPESAGRRHEHGHGHDTRAFGGVPSHAEEPAAAALEADEPPPPRSPGLDGDASSRRRRGRGSGPEPATESPRHPIGLQEPSGTVGVASSSALENLSRDDAIQLRQIRQQRAKAAREEAARKAKAAAQEKLRQKSQRGGRGPGGGGGAGRGDVAAEIQRLEAELAGDGVSAATAHGLKKRLATLKATIVREQRKQDAARRQAQREQQRQAEERKRAAAQDPPQEEPAHGDQGWRDEGPDEWTETDGARAGGFADDEAPADNWGGYHQSGGYGAAAAPWGNAANDRGADWDAAR